MHVERVVAESFVAAIEQVEDAEARALLEKVCDLHVLTTIERDLAWFMGHHRITPGRAKTVTSLVNGLLDELRPHALTLVEGFGIPVEWLGAEIATGAEAERQRAAGTAPASGAGSREPAVVG